MTGYPPQPWDLRGQMHASAFLVPLADVPVDLPPGHTPVRLGRFGVVTAAWVSYEPGGVLSYQELMATVLVRHGWRLRPTITAIWVDSVASRDGGRALWAIPKELAEFAVGDGRFAASDEKGPIATGVLRRRLRLPGRLPIRFAVAQSRAGAAVVSPVVARGSLAFSRSIFEATPGGPLGFLTGRRPLLTLSLGEFRMAFGR
ncbi:acetoacetate decarboxylase family protein [uncultured Jatrophihabitans sp.]|uniref:acetoacetate decarboxylase family protein n=1 Tax=uncultured Jatrophihabitans sp. TaxID=1610747 RepID=UPI0035CCA5BD